MRLPQHWPGWLFIIAWAILIIVLFSLGAESSCQNEFCERIIWE
jgi:hypothetical protein